MKTIQVGNLTIDGSKLFLIAGPCVIEGYDRTLMIGREIKKICERLGVQYIFKASYDKANRSSFNSFRGPGLDKGLEILASIKKELQVPVLSDVHDVTQLEKSIQGPGHDPNPGIPLPPDRPCLRRSQDRRTGQCEEGPVHGSRKT